MFLPFIFLLVFVFLLANQANASIDATVTIRRQDCQRQSNGFFALICDPNWMEISGFPGNSFSFCKK